MPHYEFDRLVAWLDVSYMVSIVECTVFKVDVACQFMAIGLVGVSEKWSFARNLL